MSQSFYSQVNPQNNTSDILDIFTDHKITRSISRNGRSISREGKTFKALENRLSLKIGKLSDKHEKFVQRQDDRFLSLLKKTE